MSENPTPPTRRWFMLPEHDEHERLEVETWPFGPVRFALIAAGRRSYKSERLKRRAVRHCLASATHSNEWVVLGGPTHQQAKRIFWDDVKSLSPKAFVRGQPSESELTITYATGAQLTVAGLDMPSRIEGRALDFLGVTEFANIKPGAWEANFRPMLDNMDETAERLGCAWLEGVPEGKRNDLWKQRCKFLEEIATGDPSYGVYCWKSADVLPARVIEAARRSLDARTFRQEYEASFEDYTGRAYYPFQRAIHAAEPLPYNPRADLYLCFDFNLSPGVALVMQEFMYSGAAPHVVRDKPILGAIGEVWIPQHSNTPMVCRQIAATWGKHEGPVIVYGDATGGNRGTAKLQGSDWDLIFASDSPLRRAFGGRMRSKVPRRNGPERSRVNAVNTLLSSADGIVRHLVDPAKCPRYVEDLEGTTTLDGTDGELNKKSDPERTHITDAAGYCIVSRYPVGRQPAAVLAAEDIWMPA